MSTERLDLKKTEKNTGRTRKNISRNKKPNTNST